MSKEGVAVMLSAMTMLSEMGGSSFANHKHEQKKVEKISYKGMSAEEMGTSHKRKSRRLRKKVKQAEQFLKKNGGEK